MAVTRDDVRNIAALARVAVPPDRVDALVAELNGILSHMDALGRVPDAGAAAAAADAVAGMRLSPDVASSVALERPPSDIAPAWRDGFFLVPRLSTHEGLGAAADQEHSA